MNRIAIYAIACGIVALSATIQAALPVSEIPAAPLMNNADCAATAAVHRAACLTPASPGAEQRKVQCEDAVNLRQRICMIEVLEALHPGLAQAPPAQD